MGAAAAMLICGTLLGVYVGRRPAQVSSPTQTQTPSPAIDFRADNAVDTARPVDAEPRFF
jgi:hypothetical protein